MNDFAIIYNEPFDYENNSNFKRINTTGLVIDKGYIEWQITRIAYLIDLFGEGFFVGKKILELGCFHGGISKLLHNLLSGTGSLTCVEGFLDNYNYCKTTYPNINFIHADLDSPDTNKWQFDDHYDIIVHWGLLYHLQYPIQSIQSCLKHCDMLFLESVTVDTEILFQLITEKNIWGTDQALHNIGSRANIDFIESAFRHLNFKRYDDPKLNANNQPKYNLPLSNSGKEHRKFWIIKTK